MCRGGKRLRAKVLFEDRDALTLPIPVLPPDPVFFGGGERVRTDDLLRARQALSQLSYTPTICKCLKLRVP